MPSPLVPAGPNMPLGEKGEKLPLSSTGRVTAMKAVRATTLTATSTALTRALSVVPMTSSQVTPSATTMAGTLIRPWVMSACGMKPFMVHTGPALNSSGSSNPVTLFINPMK